LFLTGSSRFGAGPLRNLSVFESGDRLTSPTEEDEIRIEEYLVEFDGSKSCARGTLLADVENEFSELTIVFHRRAHNHGNLPESIMEKK
jgi:hypothetical protein